jgi:hypothetical protein
VDYEGAMDLNPRIIMWDYSFTARINLFGPMTNTSVIDEIGINFLGYQEYDQ